MVKIPGPLMSISAAGWLGGDTYGKLNYNQRGWVLPKGVLPNPYPIGFGSNILIPSGWTLSNFGNTYKIPRWGLRPYGPFISNYYSNLGWCYQRRRTWHGIIYSAIRPPISENKQTYTQLFHQMKFHDAVTVWQGMNQATKDIYERWRHPVHASGYNRFLRWYLKFGPGPTGATQFILAEDGSIIKSEANEYLIQDL
jgi:hypothetical protein